ncbi:MAG TPA: M28 family peptidase [Candidatus Limnocylindrales bacterium]|nr:M28 family peptidase [Candidatus Limnocylindrales bacterium]
MTDSLLRRALLVAIAGMLIYLPAASQGEKAPAESQRYLNDIKALTTPAMEGRGDGTKGLIRAEKMIVRRYKDLGLEPAGENGYLQPFSVITDARLKGANHLKVQEKSGRTDLKLNQDFVPFSFSASGTATGQVVFAGYGATAGEFGYDDYAGIDVKDKIVLLLRYEPAGFAAKSGNQGPTQHSQLITKAINARNHGAKAVVLVNGKLNPGEQDALTRFGSSSGPLDSGILLVQIKNTEADQWLQAAGKSLAQVQEQINTTGKPESFALPESLHVSLAVNVEHTHATVNNVLAYLPGRTDEYVILGAHYDHLGRGNFDSLAPSLIGQIHPGADDNASGTAGVLELARELAPMKGRLRRGILFANFAGEELGLLGSAAWVNAPTKPLDKAIAMLNMDMIGRIRDNKIYIGGVGTGSTLKDILEKAQPNPAFKIEYSPGGYSSSDHTSFVSKKIPVLFFFSGLHSDYHKPSDTWDKINAGAAVHLLAMVEKATEELDAAPERPVFKVVAEDKPVGGGGGGGYGAYFGSIPDFGQVENGVKFSDVKPGSPAAKAGLKGGDVLVQFGNMPIKNLYDFTDALRRGKPGDVVEVTVLRDGKPMKAKVTLEQRR